MGKQKFADSGGFGIGQIDLPEGVRIQALIAGEMGDWEIGMPMKIETHAVMKDDDNNDLCTYRFVPINTGTTK